MRPNRLEVETGFLDYTGTIPADNSVILPVGSQIFEYIVVMSEQEVMMLRVTSSSAARTLRAGLFFLLCGVLFGWYLYGSNVTGGRKLLTLLIASGLIFLWLGINDWRKLLIFDGKTGSMFVENAIGRKRHYAPDMLGRITIAIEQLKQARERMNIVLRDRDNKAIRCLFNGNADSSDAEKSILAAVVISRLLNIPVDVYGNSTHGSERLRQFLYQD